jgi:ATP-binding cassette subfamily C (CFTR/MRP) protein 1
MIFSVPLNTLIANFLKNLQIQQMKNKDKRSRLMSELLANIRRYDRYLRMTLLDADRTVLPLSIKLYAWEHAFLRRILFVRNEQELKMLKKIGIFSVRIYPTVLETE